MRHGNVCLCAIIQRLLAHIVRHGFVGEYLGGNVNRRLVVAYVVTATQDTQTGDIDLFAVGCLREHSVEIVERGAVILCIITQFRHTHTALLHIRVACDVGQRLVFAQGIGLLTQAVIGIGYIVLCRRAVAAARAVLVEIDCQRRRRTLVVALHVLQFRGGETERVVLGGNLHVHAPELLGISQILVDISVLHIECLQTVQRRIGLFASGIGLYRMLVGGNGFGVLVQVAVEHSPLQRRLAGEVAVRVGLEQLFVRGYRSTLVVQLQLRTRRLVETVVSIVRLRIARYQRAHRIYLLLVFVLQTLCISALERGIIRPRAVLVHHLTVVGNG